MSIATTIKAMRAAGVPDRQIIDTILAMDEERLAGGRARVAKHRNNKRNGNVTSVTDVTSVTCPSSSEVSPQTPLPNSSNPIPPSPPKGGSSPAEFDDWYRHYPHKVGRGQAERAFPAARRQASLEALIEATQRYAAKTDDRPWKNPATWLNGKCWLDAPAAQPPPRQASPPKPKSIGQMFIDDAIEMGLINEPSSPAPRRVEASDGSREGCGTGVARPFTVPHNLLGRLG